MVINVSTEPDVITIESDENNLHGEHEVHFDNSGPLSSEREDDHEEPASDDSEEEPQRVVITRESLILQHQAESLRISAYAVQDPFVFKGPLKEEYM